MANGIMNVHVDIGADKISDKTRIERAGIVGTMAKTTSLFLSDAGFKISVDNLVQAGDDLDDADKQVAQIEASLAKARGTQDTRRNVYDKVYGLCVAGVEVHSKTPEDVQSYGFAVLAKSAPGLVLPADLQVKYDPVKGAIRVHVLYASGKHHCVVEISADPADEHGWKRLDGSGVNQTITGYAPGTWWIRAATLRAKERSAWVGPVAVIVK
ncbi:MAG: hypothetical protein ABI193_02965 [Minicystis sp.]